MLRFNEYTGKIFPDEAQQKYLNAAHYDNGCDDACPPQRSLPEKVTVEAINENPGSDNQTQCPDTDQLN